MDQERKGTNLRRVPTVVAGIVGTVKASNSSVTMMKPISTF